MKTAPPLVLLATAFLLLGAGCQKKQVSEVRADGSSTVYPITEAVAEEFQRERRDVRSQVGVSGTGGGFKKFCAGEIDVANASRPIKQSEVALCEKNGIAFIEVPVAYDGIAVVVHPGNTWVKSLTTSELKRMWEPAAQGRVMRWSDVRPEWPDQEIHLYGAGVDSGTYDYFTEAIVQQEHASRGDYTSSEDDNVLVQGVAGDPLALGFFGHAYYEENKDKLRVVPIVHESAEGGAGQPVAPSPETVGNGTYQPLSRPIFIYLSARALERPEVAEFARFYLKKAPELVPQVGYIALPSGTYALARQRLEQRTTGSMLAAGGSQVGVSLEALMRKGAPRPGQPTEAPRPPIQPATNTPPTDAR
jgi:phosphate transport system substrate-binding protein